MTSVVPFRGQSVDPEKTTDVVAIIGLSTSESPQVRGALARNPATPDWLRTKLATDPSYVVRNSIMMYGQADGHQLDVGLMRLLARDENFIVRAAVPSLTGCPQDLIGDLASDAHGYVRSMAAQRTTDPDLLMRLSKDGTSTVRKSVAANPATPVHALVSMVNDLVNGVRVILATSGHPEVLSALEKDQSVEVRRTLAANEAIPERVQRVLVNDPYVEVVLALLENPAFQENQSVSLADVVEGLLRRVGTKSHRVVERVVALNGVPVEHRAHIAARSRSPRVRSRFFDALTPAEVSGLALSNDEKIRQYASRYLVRAAVQ